MSLDDMGHGSLAALFSVGCLGLVLLFIITILLNSVALMYLWAWFVVVPFGLPALSIGQALGLSGLVSFMTYQYNNCKESDDPPGLELTKSIVYSVGRPLIALILGRIIYFFTYGQ